MPFVVFEGSEGMGKSTQIKSLFEKLKNKKTPVLQTREPGGTLIAEEIRNLFKNPMNNKDSFLKHTEFFLVTAARNEHVQKVILPNLKNHIILCDRFLDSTYIYQCILGDISKQFMDNCSHEILKGLIPDVTFVFTCDVDTIYNRIQKTRKNNNDRFDSESKQFHELLIAGYEKIVHDKWAYPCGNIPLRIPIQASHSIESIEEEINLHLKNILGISL